MLQDRALVIIPVYNEETTLKSVLEDLNSAGFSRILVVNDGSKDASLQIAEEFGVLVVSHEVNLGYGAALRTGFTCFLQNTKYKYAVTFDADGQMSPADVFKLLETAENSKLGYVYGARNFSSTKSPISRYIIGKFADVFTATLCQRYVRDTQSGLRCLNRDLLEKMVLSSSGFSIPSELIIQAIKSGQTPVPVEIKAVYTKYSLSKGQKLTNAFKVALDLLK